MGQCMHQSTMNTIADCMFTVSWAMIWCMQQLLAANGSKRMTVHALDIAKLNKVCNCTSLDGVLLVPTVQSAIFCFPFTCPMSLAQSLYFPGHNLAQLPGLFPKTEQRGSSFPWVSRHRGGGVLIRVLAEQVNMLLLFGSPTRGGKAGQGERWKP